MKPLELYIHIPFCIKKCKYCDFLSAPSTERERQEYVSGLCRQICSYRDLAEAYHIVSIFVGGGTPSILEPPQMQEIFDAVYGTFRVDQAAEITVEVNPGTVDKGKLARYRVCGVNRLSIGLQSADLGELKTLGRIHTYEDFQRTFDLAREEGFQNINVDLMSAIPGQNVESFEESLAKTAELKPEHLSVYSLIIEEGTPFYERYKNGAHARELPDEETERKMYRRTRIILDDYGYHRYEISNYAKKGYQCRHNLGYWERQEYLGIGYKAASLIGNQRWTQGGEVQILSVNNQMEEYMFLGLRKIEGVSRDRFQMEFDKSMDSVFGNVIQKMCRNHLIEAVGDNVYLTERGIDLSNYVMSEFLL